MAIARQRIRLPRASWRQALIGLCRRDLWDGEQIAEFEQAFASWIGVPAAVAVPSGRAGLSFVLESLQLEPGEEVICSAFGYPVVPYLVKSLGYSLKFVDCETRTLGMDPEALEAAISDKTRAVIATHLYGVPCRIREIAQITDRHGASLIEDCAHCYSATVGDRRTGAFGLAGYFSFETSKVINTMGGGMITTRDPSFAQRVRSARGGQQQRTTKWLLKRLVRTSFEAAVTHPLLFNAMVYPALRYAPRRKGAEDRFASGYHGDEVSLRGKMGLYTNYQARLGRRQMEQASLATERRVANARRLIEQLGDRVQFQEPAAADVSADYMLVTALFAHMQRVANALLRMGIDTKHHYMRDCTTLCDAPGQFPNAARVERQALHLPAYPQLSDRQIDRVADKIRQAVALVEGSDDLPRPVHASD